jgi:hypothetical protein
MEQFYPRAGIPRSRITPDTDIENPAPSEILTFPIGDYPGVERLCLDDVTLTLVSRGSIGSNG